MLLSKKIKIEQQYIMKKRGRNLIVIYFDNPQSN